jgi:hypothetical protein
VPIEPTTSGHYGGEAHPNLERNSRLLGDYRDVSVGPNRFRKKLEEPPHGLVDPNEQQIEFKAPTRMGLVLVGELPFASWASPQ